VQGVETQIFSYPQFKFWFRFEGDCDPGDFTSEDFPSYLIRLCANNSSFILLERYM